MDFHHRLQPTRRHTHGAPHNTGFGQRRIEDAVGAEIHLQTVREFEDSALALHHFLGQILFTAAIGHVFAKDQHALVVLHLIAQRVIDQVRHGLGRACLFHRFFRSLLQRRGLPVKRWRLRIEIRRIDPVRDGIQFGQRRYQGPIRRLLNILIDHLLHRMQARFVENAFLKQEAAMPGKRIARHFIGQLRRRTVELFIVRKRVRIGSRHMSVQESRTLPGTDVINRAVQRGEAGNDVRAIKFLKVKSREIRHQLRNVAAGGLRFHRHGNGIVVILNANQQR